VKVIFVTLVVLGVGLGPGAYMARRRRKGDEGGRLWLARVVTVAMTVVWLVAIVAIVKSVW
jgi:hypothetical protein